MRQNLIFDADDTLWENNVLFERAQEAFVEHLAHPRLTPDEVRAHLEEVERVNTKVHGYGVDGFERSLLECLTRLRDGHGPSEADRVAVRRMCAPIREHDIELIDGVGETLRELAQRHALYLLTKGDHAEQTAKIEASGLAGWFSGVRVVAEKETPVYSAFATEHALDPETTWMIGNSPRSDVWPALGAGLGAVHVPHPLTWSLEARELPAEHDRFLTVSPIAGLREHF